MDRVDAVKNCVSTLIRGKNHRGSPISDGYYNRIPLHVGDWVLESNTEDEVVWRTTATDGEEKYLHIHRTDDGCWKVNQNYGAYQSQPVSSLQKWTQDCSEDLDRRHAFWHAQDIMMGNTEGPPARGRLAYYFEEVRPPITDVDVFFNQPSETQSDPFREHITEESEI